MSNPTAAAAVSSASASSASFNIPQINKPLKALGDDIWTNKTAKINAELFTLTYGSIVAQLCHDYKRDFKRVNEKLFQMGYNIGNRIIEDFLARTALPRCYTLETMGEVLSKVAFKIFLNITPKYKISNNNNDLILTLGENPLSDFVELPSDAMKDLWYSNILCGVLKGALEMVQLDCQVEFLSDMLRGDSSTEIRIFSLKLLKDEIPAGED
ncbi:probable Trafficking protein particle complex subunit BET3 [Saccharomycodes ludwigii]|uniref:Trafficking protein particle complex subunit BET3 n=1 Tax=Saccharomycodes ludwigii TaxID=36035 RepID=A0A376B3P2_9ASCO|nr:hypothetical protein SCDLUD_003165 [Saccharomycodes ludwigii]KAH3900194.1 hypothetical protein SCDLUD_003165 [Saccharomycodes ludwigii]SSD59271.1 probable Trafficking protein particle complex subunit BET3 [Saccharomycodes ludwigii]